MGGTIVGVDFGATSIRAVEVRSTRHDKTVVRLHEVPLPHGAVRGGEVIEVGTVSAALKRLWAAGKFSTKDVVLGMGGAKVYSRDVTLPLTNADRFHESLPFQVQELLPMPVGEALLDFYAISQESTPEGPVVNGLLIAAVKEAVMVNVDAALRAGLNPVQVDLIPFALTRALAPHGAVGGAVVLIDIGAATTNLVISQNGVPLFVRMIASGGEDVTRGISSRLQIPTEQAETLKRQFGLARGTTRPEDRAIVEAVYAAAWELVSSIRDTLSFYTSARRAVPLTQLVLTGGASNLPGIQAALSELTGLPATAGGVLDHADLAKPLRRLPRDAQDAMGTAYGLALGMTA